MIPIFEQGKGKGIGHSLQTFQERFEKICQDELRENKAKAFAFIFWDFKDQILRDVLKDEAGFTILDRLAGTNLGVFYLNTNTSSRKTISEFNSSFIGELGFTEKVALPCVVFFKLKNDKFEDITVAQLEVNNIITALHEITEEINKRINPDGTHANSNETHDEQKNLHLKSLKWIKSGASFMSLQAFVAVVQRAVTLLIG